MATVQMNTRIDASLKMSGDMAIRASGITPSDMVRKLWTFAARNRHKPAAIRDLIDSLDENTQTTIEEGAAASSRNRGLAIVESYFEQTGTTPPLRESLNYEQLKEEAYDAILPEWDRHAR